MGCPQSKAKERCSLERQIREKKCESAKLKRQAVACFVFATTLIGFSIVCGTATAHNQTLVVCEEQEVTRPGSVVGATGSGAAAMRYYMFAKLTDLDVKKLEEELRSKLP